jgi:hypothetical protein
MRINYWFKKFNLKLSNNESKKIFGLKLFRLKDINLFDKSLFYLFIFKL